MGDYWLHRAGVQRVAQAGSRGAPWDVVRCDERFGFVLWVARLVLRPNLVVVYDVFLRRTYLPGRRDFCLYRVVPVLVCYPGESRINPYFGDVSVRAGAGVANRNGGGDVFPVVVAEIRPFNCRVDLLLGAFYLRYAGPKVSHRLEWDKRGEVAKEVGVAYVGFFVVLLCVFQARGWRLKGLPTVKAGGLAVDLFGGVWGSQVVDFVVVISVAVPVEEDYICFCVACPGDTICL